MTFQPCKIPTVETERLMLRGWREDDLEMVTGIYGDEQTARHIGGTLTRWQAWRRMAVFIGHWQLRGFGLWVVEDKKDHAVMGYCGPWAPEGWPENEIGYALLPQYHGKGIITEAAIASLGYAYNILNWKTAISFIDSDNIASQKVVERMGATIQESTILVDEFPVDIWRHLPPKEFMERFA